MDMKIIAQQCAQIESRFLSELEANKNDTNKIIEITDYYHFLLESVTSSLLEEEPISDFLRQLVIDVEVEEENPIQVTDDIKDFIIKNASQVLERKIAKTIKTPTTCLLCDKLIKGFGLLDTVDAGLNAVCFDCMNEHHYIGGGTYVTYFE